MNTITLKNVDLALLKKQREALNNMLFLGEPDSNGEETHFCADKATCEALLGIQNLLDSITDQAASPMLMGECPKCGWTGWCDDDAPDTCPNCGDKNLNEAG